EPEDGGGVSHARHHLPKHGPEAESDRLVREVTAVRSERKIRRRRQEHPQHAEEMLLAIESACDETAAAIVQGDARVLADVVSTQVERHAPFGGVVPEIASREHMATLARVVEQALQGARCEITALDAVAVTLGPGLIGSLFVGVMFAKGLALARK